MRKPEDFVIIRFGALKRKAIFRKNNCWWKKLHVTGGTAKAIVKTPFSKKSRYIEGFFFDYELVITPRKSVYYIDSDSIVDE